MNSEQEISTLVLNTLDISTNVSATTYNNGGVSQTIDNQYGRISDNRCNLTWKNINLRNLLGTLYDRYETFNLYLYQIAQTGGFNGVPSSSPNLCVDIRLKGLPFLNNSYNTSTGINTESVFLTSYMLNNNISTNIGSFITLNNSASITFGKSSNNVDLTIDMKTTKDRIYPVVNDNQSFGTFNFIFKIQGIPSTTNSYINGSRMNIR